MENKTYLFAIQDDQNNFYDADGNLSANPYLLDFSPDGWNGIKILNKRNKEFFGVDRSVTVPLSYVEDGAKIIKKVVYNQGIEAPLYLAILQQQLEYLPTPLGIITGGGVLVNGVNVGTIIGTPGEVVYVKFTFTINGSDSITGSIYQDIFPLLVNITSTAVSPLVVPLIIPTSGVINFTLNFINANSSNCKFELANSNGSTTANYTFWHKQIYKGEIDTTTFTHTGAKVTCNTLEDGIVKYLKASQSTVQEFPMDVVDAVNVKMDGIILRNKVDTFVSNGDNISDPNFDFSNHTIETQIVQEDAPFVGGKKATSRVRYGATNVQLLASDEWLLNSTVNAVIDFSYSLDFTLNMVGAANPAERFNIAVAVIPPSGIVTNSVILFTNPNVINGLNRSYQIQGSGSISINAGEKLFFYGFSTVVGAGGDATLQVTYNNAADNFFNYSYKYRHPPSICKAFRLQYLFTLLTNFISGGKITAQTSVLLNKYKDVVITSGNALRALPDATMKISFKDLYKFLNSIDSVGLNQLETSLGIERKKDLIDFNNAIDLGTISGLKVSFATDFFYNEVEYGYPEINNELGLLNGNEEFNCKFLKSLGTTKKPAKLDMVSPIIASCYTIEQIRITQLKKDSTDYKNDNKLFALHIESTQQPDATYNLNRALNASVTAGLIEPLTVFNLFLSPQRNLIRNGDWLRSSMFKCDQLGLKFSSADKNSKLVCDGIIENRTDFLGGFDAPYFYPIYFDFNIPSPSEILNLLELNPLQIFNFNFEGNNYSGILNEVTVEPSNDSVQQYQLLSTTTNNLAKLIDYYG